MRRTKEQAAETGRQVLIAAEGLFLEKGYDNVSLEEVAARAGVTRGAVHWHFKTKRGLLLALRDKVREPIRKLADELSSNDGAASLERLGRLICEMLHDLERDQRQQSLLRVMLRLDIALANQAKENGSSFYDEMTSTMLQIFEAIERDSGLAPPWTPRMAASMLSATITGLVMEWALQQQTARLSPDGAAFISLMLSSWTR